MVDRLDAAGLVEGVAGLGTPYHVGVVTRSVEEAMPALSGVFDLQWSRIREGAEPGLSSPDGPLDWSARVAHSLGGPMHIELLQGSPGSVWETEALAELHHFAFWCDDVAGDVARLQDDGWSIELTFYEDDGRVRNVAYLRKPEEPRVELVDSVRRDAYLEFLASCQQATA